MSRIAGYALLALASALLFQMPTALAQSNEDEEELARAYGDKNFVNIATGTKQLLRKAPSAATVITAQDISAMGATTLSEVLEAVPGMHMSRNTLQNIYTPAYGMRGILTLFDADICEPTKAGSGIVFDLPMPGRSVYLQAV